MSRPDTPSGRPSFTGPPPFTCSYRHDEAGTAWVTPQGELDLATTATFGAALEASCAAAPLAVLDLRGLSFIDTAGVRSVVKASMEAARAGRRAVVLADGRQVRLFDLTGTSGDVALLELEGSSTAVAAILGTA